MIDAAEGKNLDTLFDAMWNAAVAHRARSASRSLFDRVVRLAQISLILFQELRQRFSSYK